MSDAVLAAFCAVLGFGAGLFLDIAIVPLTFRQRLRWAFRCPRCPMLVKARPPVPLARLARPGGRCPICANRLPLRYFLVPVVNAALFAAMAWKFGADAVLPAYLVAVTSLLAVSIVDSQLRIIPNFLLYPAIFAVVPLMALASLVERDVAFGVAWALPPYAALVGYLLAVAGGEVPLKAIPAWLVNSVLVGAIPLGIAAGATADLAPFWGALGGGAATCAVMWAVYRVAPAGGLGFGDVRLSFLLGMMLGWFGYGRVFVGMFLGFGLGAVLGVVLMALGLKGMKSHFSFGPFLAAGTIIGVLWGEPLVDAWLRY